MASPANDGLRIFRAAEAPDLMTTGSMKIDPPFSPVQRTGVDRMNTAGYGDGSEVSVLVDVPGFSLTQVWFKKDYPLPLHRHDVDCLYHIIAGSVRLGTEDLGPRDSFLVPAGVPYTYRPGPEGVELLEIRQQGSFGFTNLANGESYWNRALETCVTNSADWKTAQRPSRDAPPKDD